MAEQPTEDVLAAAPQAVSTDARNEWLEEAAKLLDEVAEGAERSRNAQLVGLMCELAMRIRALAASPAVTPTEK